MPSLDVPCLRKPQFGDLTGPIDQYNRKRYLDMATLSHNMVLTKRLLEDEQNNWSKNGIPLAWKVIKCDNFKLGERKIYILVLANIFYIHI